MNYNSNDNHHSYHDITSAAVKRTPATKHLPPGTMSTLYKLAARNLREHHGVPSMTALKLEKTVAVLRLAPRRLVVQRLAPRRLLKGDSPPLVSAGEGSGKGEEEPCGTETCELMETSDDSRTNNSSSSGAEEKGVSDDSDSMNDKINNSINNNGGDTKDDVEVLEADGKGKASRPIHAALVAGGIDLHPSDTRPLLRALGVRPHRLVRFGLVKRGAVCAMPRRRGGGPGQRQHLRAGGPRQGHVGRPHGAPHGSPHGHGGWPMHGPPRPFHGDAHHTMHLGEEIEDEGVSAPLGPHGGSGPRGHRHVGGRRQGPPHGPGRHGLSTVRYGRGPPGGGMHGHEHRHHAHGHGHGEGEGEEGRRLHGGAPGPGPRGPRRHAGGMVTSFGPPHGPPRGPFHEGASGALHGMMAHPHHNPPSRGGDM